MDDIIKIEKEAAKKGLIPPLDSGFIVASFCKIRAKIKKSLQGKKYPVAKLKAIQKAIRAVVRISGKDPSLLMFEGMKKRQLDCDLVCGIYLSIAREMNFPLYGAFLPSHTILVWGKHPPYIYFDTLSGSVVDTFCFKRWKVNPPSPLSDNEFMSTYYNTLGVRCAEDGKYQDAILFFNKALKCYSLDARLYYHRAVSLAHLGHYKQAVRWCKKAINLDSSDWKAYFNMGVCLSMSGKYKEAVSFYNRTIQINPKENYLIYYHRANALLHCGKLDLAINDYQQALFICPNDSSLRKDYETALHYSQEL